MIEELKNKVYLFFDKEVIEAFFDYMYYDFKEQMVRSQHWI